MVTLGVIALVAGALAAILLWLGADDRYDDGVVGLLSGRHVRSGDRIPLLVRPFEAGWWATKEEVCANAMEGVAACE